MDILASKEVTSEDIARVEDYYRSLYEEENPNVKIEFPKKYPTSALLGMPIKTSITYRLC